MVRQSAPETITPVFDAAREVQDFLQRSGCAFCFIGELEPLLELRETPANLEKLQQLRSKVEKGA